MIFLLIILLNPAWARIHPNSERLASHDGYVLSLDEEKDQEYIEIILPQQLAPVNPKKSWTKKIFEDDQLSAEFKEKYERQFGYTEADQAQSVSSPFVFVDFFNPSGAAYRGTITDYQNQRELFAQYMVRRMLENNLDRFVKNEPAIRAVYEIKERVSKADVAVVPGYSVSLNYNLSANQIQSRLVNPYAIVEFTLQMYPGGVFGDVQEQYYRIGKELTKKFSINTYFRQFDDVLSFVFRLGITPLKAYTLTTNTNTRAYGRAIREDSVLVGLYWKF